MKSAFLFLLVSLVACNDDDANPVKKAKQDSSLDASSQKKQDSEVKSFKATFLTDGFNFTEGPLWLENEETFIFSDLLGSKVYSWAEGEEKATVIQEASSFSNGHAILNGVIYSAHHDRSIKVWGEDNSYSNFLTEIDGKKMNSPNDLIFDKAGNLYFTDPTFGIIGFGPEEAEQEQPVQGIYKVNMTDKSTILLNGDLKQPNGIAFSPDESAMYVSDSTTGEIWKFSFTDDSHSEVKEKTLFAKVLIGDKPHGDGLRVDAQGNVYSAALGGVWIFNPEGKLIKKIETQKSDEFVSNFAFGGKSGSFLFITAADKVYGIELSEVFP